MDYDLFHFVKSGAKRIAILKTLDLRHPINPTDLSLKLQMDKGQARKILQELERHGLVVSHDLPNKKGCYRLSPRGDLAHKVLHTLLQCGPMSKSCLCKTLHVHHKEVTPVLKILEKDGLIAPLRNTRPARRVYQLTEQGEYIKERLKPDFDKKSEKKPSESQESEEPDVN